MNKRLSNIYSKIHSLLASRRFFCLVVTLFVIQSVWIALSFRFPMLYDEAYHFDAIKLFSNQISPILTEQPLEYDIYGSMIGGGATLFHYLMSYPYRIFELFTSNLAALVISARLIGVALVAFGLVLFDRIFKNIGIKQIYTNVGLLVFVMLPIVPFVAATINYDNLLFPLTAWFFLVVIRILNTRGVLWIDLVKFTVIGCAASLTKFTFLPIFLVSIIFLLIVLAIRHKNKIISAYVASFGATNRYINAAAIVVLITFVGMFSVLFLKNTLEYGTPRPSCQQVIGAERCLSHAGGVRNKNAFDTRDTRPLMQPPEYISSWVIQMENWTNMTGQRVPVTGTVVKNPLPIIYTAFFILSFLAVSALIAVWNKFKKGIGWYYLSSIVLVTFASVFIQNYALYSELHIAYAVQPRYLLTVVPLLIVASVFAVSTVLKKNKSIKALVLLCILVLFTQGGGIITHVVLSNETWNWNNSTVKNVNNNVRTWIEPLVKQ